jgi:transposase
MLDEATALPDDPDDLRSLAERLIAEVKAQAVLIEKLRHQLAGHRAHRFGASAQTAEQLQLALETSELAAAAMTAKLRLPEPVEEKGKPKRRPIPDHVPRTEIELLPKQDDCATCGGRLRQVGKDVTEELEYVPGRFIVNRIARPRFACSGCDSFTQVPLPSRPIERGRPGPGLLAQVLVGKYADHLPLYRQSQVYAREGIDLDRSTLADWVGKSTALLEPLSEAIGRHVLSGHAIHADDTPVRMLAPGTGKTRTARLWAYVRDERPWAGPAPPAALYRFSEDRKGIRPARHLAGFKGWMHADGYAGFEELYRGGAIREVACLAHVRRKFVDVHRSQGSAIAEEAIARIAELYTVEKAVRGSAPEERVRARQEHAAPVFDALEAWLAEQLPALSGKTPLAVAIRYALNRLPRLRPYLSDGSLEIDNNGAERAMRGAALGRRTGSSRVRHLVEKLSPSPQP